MIVVDASVVTEVLLRTARGRAVQVRLSDPDESLHAPHLLDLEIASVLRRLEAARKLDARRAGEALSDLTDLDVTRYGHEALVPRMWALRHAMTVYDAAYVALAEALDVPLLTADRKLARVPGIRAPVELVT